MNNKQTTKCTECFKEITTENYSGDNCNSCTGTTETKFSDFIRNSTEEEATEVFTDIMKGVAEDQKVILKTTLEERFEFTMYDLRGEWANELVKKELLYQLNTKLVVKIALAVQQRDEEIIEKARKLFEDENPVDCIDGETPVETYGYEATFNNGIKAVIEVIKKNL